MECDICKREIAQQHNTIDDCIDETIDISSCLDIDDDAGFDREMTLLDLLIDRLPDLTKTMTDKRPEGEEDE